jgi:hypothetical protein
MAFSGHGQFGYDPVKEVYVGTWIDNMSPHLNQMEGTFDPATKTMTMISRGIDPRTGQESKSKMITKYVNDDTRLLEMSTDMGGGKFVKNVEITYKRRKS